MRLRAKLDDVALGVMPITHPIALKHPLPLGWIERAAAMLATGKTSLIGVSVRRTGGDTISIVAATSSGIATTTSWKCGNSRTIKPSSA